jgi:hypothetical protein
MAAVVSGQQGKDRTAGTARTRQARIISLQYPEDDLIRKGHD